jgi:hypothetical protein
MPNPVSVNVPTDRKAYVINDFPKNRAFQAIAPKVVDGMVVGISTSAV